MAEVCSGLVLGVVRKEEDEDRWQWGGERYSVKNAYLYLTEDECEEPGWVKEVWSSLILTRMSILVWRLLQ
ncbi:hypothetical protein A2U01_0088876, partial [Trifolium medium]|nr:hypothetical protein [Trifolium medium]